MTCAGPTASPDVNWLDKVVAAIHRHWRTKPERFSLKERAPFGELEVMKPNQVPEPRREAYQTVRLQIDTKNAVPSIRIGFTDQRLTAHGGLIVWSHFLRQKKFRQQLREVLPHDPTSPNAYDPTDVALGYVGGILCGADKLSRVALVAKVIPPWPRCWGWKPSPASPP